MSPSKPRSFLVISITILCLIAAPLQSLAADKSKIKATHSAKERLVLMPIRVPEEDKNLTGAMETALVKGLQQKYDVFSGERVAQKAHEIFMKESRNTAHTECDETRCMQNIAEAFQAELIATANVTKQDGSYFLAISIQNIFDNKVEYSESLPCKNCDAIQVVEKLKEISAGITTVTATYYFNCQGGSVSKVIHTAKQYGEYANPDNNITVRIGDQKISFSGNKYIGGNNLQICAHSDEEVKFDSVLTCVSESESKEKNRKYGTFNKITGELFLTNEIGKYFDTEGLLISEGHFKCIKVDSLIQ